MERLLSAIHTKKFLQIALPVIFTGFLAVYFILIKPAQATIATSPDWIGLFSWDVLTYPDWCAKYQASDVNCPTKYSTYNNQYLNYINSNLAQSGDSWFYTSSCNKTFNATTPTLGGNCASFVYPNEPGLYRFRLFANDSLYSLQDMTISGNPVNTETEAFWVNFSLTNVNSDCSGSNPDVRVTWPHFVGMDPVNRVDNISSGITGDHFYIIRTDGVNPPATFTYDQNTSPNTWTDPNPTKGANYTYKVRVHHYGDPSTEYLESTNSLSTIVKQCVPPWIQTKNGDVHSNTNISAPGGP